ncbi:B-cell antigen receptor complex-associated protein beta chain isoform X2 [Rhineura floridana]|uniref:B-cell antigen receptor complex-associated protein beta chain isoform X2 n=1 Tax=Rhineura floridana TaxID=261503 RepID=UPI002AC8810A|nr:B-cell antigen receptor complex-associated protein beta chain isoform X2 [Rhineura floridana]
MAASLFQVCGVFWATLGTLLVVTGMNITESNRTHQTSGMSTTECNTVYQKPISEKRTITRFVAARWGSTVSFRCLSDSLVTWYKVTKEGKQLVMMNSSRVQVTRNGSLLMMHIKSIQHIDNGIYFCETEYNKNKNLQQQSCGTQLKVMGVSKFEQVQKRNTLKDAIIVVQSILLVLFLSVPVFLTLGKGDIKDASDEDHTYEGLAVELADTYEDIGTYQDKVTDKWDFGENPCEE